MAIVTKMAGAFSNTFMAKIIEQGIELFIKQANTG